MGLAIREIRNTLSEVERLVDISIKLKTESVIGEYGKRASAALKKINEKTVRLMVKLNSMK